MNPGMDPQTSNISVPHALQEETVDDLAQRISILPMSPSRQRPNVQSVVTLPTKEPKSGSSLRREATTPKQRSSGSRSSGQSKKRDVTTQTMTSANEETLLESMKEVATAIKVAADGVNKYVNMLEAELQNVSDPNARREATEKLGTNPLVTMHYHNVTHLANIANHLNGQKQSPTYSQVAAKAPQLPVAREEISEVGRPDRKRRREETTPTVAKFKLVMTPKSPAAEDPRDVYRKVVGTRTRQIQLAETTIKGREGRFLFYLREHAEDALKLLQDGNFGRHKVKDLYNTFITVASTHSIRTQKIRKSDARQLQFFPLGVFDHHEARKVIFDLNPLWFESTHDVDCVEYHSIPGEEEHFLLEIYVSSRALRKFSSKSKEGKGPIDIGTWVVSAYLTERDDYCFRCLDHRHWWKNCDAKKPNCRFCEAHHLSKECPVKHLPKEHVCRNCSNANAMRDADQEVDSNHTATSTKCPWVRERIRQERKKKQVKRQKPKYVKQKY